VLFLFCILWIILMPWNPFSIFGFSSIICFFNI
jgi:hypothetical protein